MASIGHKVPQSHAVFRMLCHESRVGGIIGKNGSFVKQLKHSIGANMIVEAARIESPEQVITIIASAVQKDRISIIGDIVTNGVNGVEIVVSRAQEALLRVFERTLEMAGFGDGVQVVACKLLVDELKVTQISTVVDKIGNDSGSKLWILTEDLPACADPGDVVIEIEGDVLAVKKALVAISGHLQDTQLSVKQKTNGNMPSGGVPYQTSVGNDKQNKGPNFIGSSSANCGPGVQPSSEETENKPKMPVYRIQKKKVSFRILCPNDIIGGIFGKGGRVIKDIQKQSGAQVNIGDPVDGCEERLITIRAIEYPELPSPAQKALLLVFARLVELRSENESETSSNRSAEAHNEKELDTRSNRSKEVGSEQESDSSSSESKFAARLIIHPRQSGYLIGKGGAAVQEIWKATGAEIWVVKDIDFIPKCVPVDDQLVEISGEFTQVKDALPLVASRLRDILINPGLRTAAPPTKDGSEGGSDTEANTTVEVIVSEKDIDSIDGENNSTLDLLRQLSGAKISVHGRRPETGDYVVEISGKPEETHSAQYYLEQHILTPRN